ncbi:MAG TPA: DinB family protein [Ktedonosporobacter sp.]|nr:DinB family protein [Ktedonosporobacter sp.]
MMQERLVFEIHTQVMALRTGYIGLHTVLANVREQTDFRPAPDEWSIKEVVGHLGDALELFSEHVRHIATCTPGHLCHYDEGQLVRDHRHQEQSFDLLKARLTCLHLEFERLLLWLPLEAWSLKAEHEAWGTTSIRQLLQLLAAHYAMHTEQVQQIHQCYQLSITGAA